MVSVPLSKNAKPMSKLWANVSIKTAGSPYARSPPMPPRNPHYSPRKLEHHDRISRIQVHAYERFF